MGYSKGEESKIKLLKSAEELFATKGFKGTTVSEIVANAGFTQAAFYLYFKSKEEIFEQIIEKFNEQIIQLSNSGAEVKKVSPSQVIPFVTQNLYHIFKLLNDNINATKIALQFSHRGEDIRQKIVNQISNNMKINQSLGIVREDIDPELVAESILTTVERLVYRYLVSDEKTELELSQQVAKLYLSGILKKEESKQ